MLGQKKVFNLWGKAFLFAFKTLEFRQEFNPPGITIKPDAIGSNIS